MIQDIIDEVAERRSAWHRLDVLQATCDTTRPHPDITGTRWAAMLNRATDAVLEHCIDLDPNDHHSRRRTSDGRSVWIEPSARHHTSSEVLSQEEHIVSWAIDAQVDPPTPSTNINTDGLDSVQADAAATVAGRDRLVLVVGPAAGDLSGDIRPAYRVNSANR